LRHLCQSALHHLKTIEIRRGCASRQLLPSWRRLRQLEQSVGRANRNARLQQGLCSDHALERGAVGEQATLKANGMSMHTTLKQKHSIPPGARGLILFWILSFPMALAAMVYALGML